jgi:hypothetical protein
MVPFEGKFPQIAWSISNPAQENPLETIRRMPGKTPEESQKDLRGIPEGPSHIS